MASVCLMRQEYNELMVVWLLRRVDSVENVLGLPFTPFFSLSKACAFVSGALP